MSNSSVGNDQPKNESVTVVDSVNRNRPNNKQKLGIEVETFVKRIENVVTNNDNVKGERTKTGTVTAKNKSEATTFASTKNSARSNTKDSTINTILQDQMLIKISSPTSSPTTATSTIDDQSPGETVEQIKEELSKTFELTTVETNSECDKNVSTANSRTHYLPPHVTGEMSFGRRVSKPRLGVKVPPRNLTSQIVTQDEIARQIIEHSLRKASGTLLTMIHKRKMALNKKVIEERTAVVSANESSSTDISSTNLNQIKKKNVMKPDTNLVAASSPLSLKKITEVASTVINGNSNSSNVPETGLDHDTLLAILEDTPDVAENTADLSSPMKKSMSGTPVSKVAVVLKKTPVEKELALKQLMTFDTKKRCGQQSELVENGVSNIDDGAKLSPKRANSRQARNEVNDSSSKETSPQSQVKPSEEGKANASKRKRTADEKIVEKPIIKKSKGESEPSQSDETEPKSIVAKPKANSKVMREINRLLGDEGAINMIYSIEQKRSLGERDPNTFASLRRKKKDLLLKTKLVKNAVLRLSMSPGQELVGRTRRISPEATIAQDTSTPAAPVIAPLPPPATTTVATKPSPSPLRKSSIESNTSEPTLPPTKTRKLVAAEASRIIRRHSSSSCYSSDNEESEMVEANRKNISETNNNEMTKGKLSKSRRGSKDVSNVIAVDGNKRRSSAIVSISDKSYETPNRITFKEITLRKYDNLVQIIMIPSTTKMKNALNVQILRELISVLREVQKDEKCRAVLVTSTGSSFCQGVDLQTLIHSNQTERVKIVNEFIKTLTDFTVCLSEFRKILIAGVHGSTVGLGVTMLPFFDMVFASDKATFYTPYVKLGQIPEAGATVTLPRLLGNSVASELFFGCRMLTASEALQFGLVTRILWPDKFTEELLPLASGIASHSTQSMESTKKLLRQGTTMKLRDRLQTEAQLLREQWCSEECQRQFKAYLEQEAYMQNK